LHGVVCEQRPALARNKHIDGNIIIERHALNRFRFRAKIGRPATINRQQAVDSFERAVPIRVGCSRVEHDLRKYHSPVTYLFDPVWRVLFYLLDRSVFTVVRLPDKARVALVTGQVAGGHAPRRRVKASHLARTIEPRRHRCFAFGAR